MYPAFLMVGNALLFSLNWSSLPAELPRQFNFHGVPITFWSKSTALVFNMGFFAFMIILIFFTLYTMYTKAVPYQPAKAAVAWVVAALYAVVGLLTSINIWIVLLSTGNMNMYSAPFYDHLLMMIISILIGIGLVVSPSKYDVSYPILPETPGVWKAGIFYYNPADPKILVAKRSGLGWTLNFACFTSYLITALILLVPLLIVYFSSHSK
jgi:uncharacterized membrane protein